MSKIYVVTYNGESKVFPDTPDGDERATLEFLKCRILAQQQNPRDAWRSLELFEVDLATSKTRVLHNLRDSFYCLHYPQRSWLPWAKKRCVWWWLSHPGKRYVDEGCRCE